MNAAEQNICHLINTFNNSKHMNIYHNLNNSNSKHNTLLLKLKLVIDYV